MDLLYLLGLCFLWWIVYSLGRDLITESRERGQARIWLRWEREEAARAEAEAHRQRLAAIEAVRLEGIRKLHRIAAEARGEVIEGSCQEIERRPS
jgi:hypothetical protein